MSGTDITTLFAALSTLPDELRAIRDGQSALATKLAELAAQRDTLKPLNELLGISAKAAQMRLRRDTELKALGLKIGKRLYFRQSEVERLLAVRQRTKSP